MRWPKDNQAALIAFYGDPGSRGFGANLVKVVPPFRMTYAGAPIKTITFHKAAAPQLLMALNLVWNYFQRDQAKIDALRISDFSGSYVKRFVRGSDSKWSNHAYGAAIDIDGPHNGFNTGHGHIPEVVVAAFKAAGFSWGGDYHNRTDPMHFELCDRGDPKRTFQEWLAFYGCPIAQAAVQAHAQALLDDPTKPVEADPVDDPDIDGEVEPGVPADAPKTGVTEGAQAVGGFSLLGVFAEMWDKISSAPESILEGLMTAAGKPVFWIFAAIGCAGLYIWWQRHATKKGV